MGSYLLRRANQTIPPETLEVQFANNGVYIGVAVADNDVVQVERSFKTLDQLNAALTAFADEPVHIYFSNTDNGEEDRQPYTLLEVEEDNKRYPAIVCILEGDFSSFNKADSTFSDTYHAVEDEIRPYVLQLSEITEGDLEKVWKAISGEKFRDKMSKLWIGYGTIAFINGDGESVIVQDSKNSQNFEWGHASRVYKPGSYPASDVATKGRSLAAALQATATASGAPTSAVKPPVASAPNAAPPTATAIPPNAGLPEDFMHGKIKDGKWYPPTNVRGKPLKALVRAAHRELTGINELPVGFNKNNHAPIDIPAHKLNPAKVKTLAELPKVVGQRTLSPPPVAAPPAAPATEVEPILDEKIWEAVKDDFLTKFDFTKKIVDEKGNLIVNPEDLGANESKYPTFIQKTGIDQLEDILQFDYEDCQDLNRKYPDAGAVLTFNLINAHIGLLHQLTVVKEKLAKHEPPTMAASPKSTLPAASAPAPSGKKRVVM